MKVAIYTLGCKVNQYETQAMEQELRGRGHEIVPFGEEADAYIVNTCSVTAVSDQKSRQVIHGIQRKHPGAVVAVCGCYSQTHVDDVRKHGSGGTGATNMLRTYRLKAALLTFAGDAAKAALAVLLGRYLAGFEGGCVAAVFAIVGHMWPLYFGFRGGKGIACTVGAIAVLYPILLVPLVILWGVPVLCSRCISLGSIIAALGLTPAVALWCHGQAVEPVFPVGGAAVMTLLILWAHRENMVRLARGEENKI